MNTLRESSDQGVSLFSLQGKILPAKVVDLYDGDTATCCILLSDEICKFKMRLSGIDTPEIRPSKSNPNRELEKKAARYVRNRVLDLVTDQNIDLNKTYSKKEIKELLANNRNSCI